MGNIYQYPLKIDKEVIDNIRTLAEKDGRSLNKEIEYILNKKLSFVDPQGNSYDTKTPREFNFKEFLYGFQKDFNDKKTPKGGKIGLAQAKNGMLLGAKSLKLSSF